MSATARRRFLLERASHRWEHARADEGWKRRAACRGEDPGLWFPKQRDSERHGSRAVLRRDRQAKQICSACPVARECLGYAIALDLRYGTWGGFTELEREKLTGKRPE